MRQLQRSLLSALVAGTLCLVADVPLPVGTAAAQNSPDSASAMTTGPVTPRGRLEIQLLASRSQLTAGTMIGITGTVTNVGPDSTIYLTQGSLTLTQPPELEGPLAGIRGWWAYFPNETQTDASGNYLHPDSVVLALLPGSSAYVAWTPAATGSYNDTASIFQIVRQTIDQIVNELRFLFFAPGDYRIAVQAKYWTNPARPRLSYYTATQTMSVNVMAPQFVILLGAALGGLIAYIIFPTRRVQRQSETKTTTDDTKWTAAYKTATAAQKKSTAAMGAMLWSAVVTILLARLADSQFLVRVTVNDFWGAIAIGLVAQYAGAKWLERLLPPPADERIDEENVDEDPGVPASRTDSPNESGIKVG